MLMQKEFPSEYNFFPLTYLLPYEMYEFRKQFLSKEEIEEEERQKRLRIMKSNPDKSEKEKDRKSIVV